jgi:hypothetical protein
MTPAEVSAGLRRQALETPPFDPNAPADEPYGLIVDFLQGETVVTMTAFATGDASLYLSTGGGVIGLIGKPQVAELARSTVEALRPLAVQLERSDVTDAPRAGDFCFYVQTPGGRRVCRLNASETASRDSAKVKLIDLGGKLLSRIRESSN